MFRGGFQMPNNIKWQSSFITAQGYVNYEWKARFSLTDLSSRQESRSMLRFFDPIDGMEGALRVTAKPF